MRLVFAGSPQVALPSLEYLLESSHEVLAVLSRPDAPCGRGRKLNASPVSQRAQAAGLELYQPHSLRDNPEAVQYWGWWLPTGRFCPRKFWKSRVSVG